MATTNPTGGTGGEGNGGDRKDEGGKGKVTEKRDYRRGKRHQSYDVTAKEKILKMLDEGARNCDIVKALNVPESTVRRLRKSKDEVKKQCANARKYFTCKPGVAVWLFPPQNGSACALGACARGCRSNTHYSNTARVGLELRTGGTVTLHQQRETHRGEQYLVTPLPSLSRMRTEHRRNHSEG